MRCSGTSARTASVGTTPTRARNDTREYEMTDKQYGFLILILFLGFGGYFSHPLFPEAGPIVVVALVIITIVIAIVWGFIAMVWGFVSEIWNALKELNRHEVLPILALVAVVVGLFSFVVITH